MCKIAKILGIALAIQLTTQRAESQDAIVSDFECEIAAPMDSVFESLVDVANHNRILSNIVSRTIVDKSSLDDVLDDNEILTVSTVVEPEERLALALFRLYPPNRVEEEMLTDPFSEVSDGGVDTLDRKKGRIVWELEPLGDSTLVIIHSEFFPRTGRIYSEERVNQIWSSHCELLEIESNSR